jgi:hypothetical protein
MKNVTIETVRITAAERAARHSSPQPMRGLGDVIAAGTKAVGIKPCAGCARRQATLNKLVPFSTRFASNGKI